MDPTIINVLTINITHRKQLFSTCSFDFKSTTNANIELAQNFSLNSILKFKEFLDDPWSDLDTIIQFAWIPQLHHPIGYVLSPLAAIPSRITVESIKWDVKDTQLKLFTIVYPDGRGQVFNFRDFEIENLEKATIPEYKLTLHGNCFSSLSVDTEIIPRFDDTEIEHNLKTIYKLKDR